MYLVNEVEYVPWETALSSLDYIGDLLESNPNYADFTVIKPIGNSSASF